MIHEPVLDVRGFWFGLIKLCIEAELRQPSIEQYSHALQDKQILTYYFDTRKSARGFSGLLWIFYKEVDK